MAKIKNLGWAKPDDPIYSSGPMISFHPQLTESPSDTQKSTDGAQRAGSSATPPKPAQPLTISAQDSAPQDPMLPAMNERQEKQKSKSRI